jgi:hypothetical protein
VTDIGNYPIVDYAPVRRTRERLFRLIVGGVVLFYILYLSVYVWLRIRRVYYPFYHQGGWDDIDGTTGAYFVDMMFSPARYVELWSLNTFHWFPEPGGG